MTLDRPQSDHSLLNPGAAGNGRERPAADPDHSELAGRDRRRADRPRVAMLINALTPYRIHVQRRICREIPEAEFHLLSSHAPSCGRWQDITADPELQAVRFDDGEPSNEQTLQRYAFREYRKAGRIIRWLKQRQVAAVCCQGYGDLGRLRLLRWCHRHSIPVLLYGDANIRGDGGPSLKRWLKYAVIRQAIRWSDGLMVCGVNGRQLFERCGAAAEAVFPLPYLPDTQLFSQTPGDVVDETAGRHQLSKARRRLLFSGRVVADKRPDLVVAAMIQIADERPDWDLLMVGDGPLREPLQQRIPPPLHDRVRWTGFVHDTRELAGLFANSSVLVLPSDHEPWGVVVIEAAAAGLALVTSDCVGAAADLVQSGRNGRVVPRGSADALAAALRDVTRESVIERCRRESPEVLRQWLEFADPVAGLKNALQFCGVLPADEA